jgi:hypothetical protein
MKWVTRKTIHLDRVASPWLITRFIDPQAEFLFIDPDTTPSPTDAIPFALPGAELGMHDHEGTTFDKILRKYELASPELSKVAAVVRAGVHHVLGEDQQDAPAHAVNYGIALAMITEGLMIRHTDDYDILDTSFELYDSLFTAFWARRADARTDKSTFWARMASLRTRWSRETPLASLDFGTVS